MEKIEERMTEFAVTIIQLMQHAKRGMDSRVLGERAIKCSINPALRYLSGEIKTEKDLKQHGLPIIIALCETNKHLETMLEYKLYNEPAKVKLLQEECKHLIAELLEKINNAG
jgi:hypothetical protein